MFKTKPSAVTQIKDFLNYSITKEGKLWSNKSERFLISTVGPNGYPYYSLRKDGKTFRFYAHRLVLITFVGPCPDGMESRHLDGNRANCSLSNLCWGTHQENVNDTERHGRICKGEQRSKKLTERDVRMIIYMYKTGEFTQKEIGGIFGVHHITVHDIIQRKTWIHIWAK